MKGFFVEKQNLICKKNVLCYYKEADKKQKLLKLLKIRNRNGKSP